jgi:S-DNA-T family DNA segregation ATPase FtsK/SpoIIIE
MRTTSSSTVLDHIPDPLRAVAARVAAECIGLAMIAASGALALALVTWSVQDPSFNHASAGTVHNLLGAPGAIAADLVMQLLGLAAIVFLLPIAIWGWHLVRHQRIERIGVRLLFWTAGCLATAAFAGLLPVTSRWPLPTGLGGVLGDALLALPRRFLGGHGLFMLLVAIVFGAIALLSLSACINMRVEPASDIDDDDLDLPAPRRKAAASEDEDRAGEPGVMLIVIGGIIHALLAMKAGLARTFRGRRNNTENLAPWQYATRRAGPALDQPYARGDVNLDSTLFDLGAYAPPSVRAAQRYDDDFEIEGKARVTPGAGKLKSGQRLEREVQPSMFDRFGRGKYQLPPLLILSEAKRTVGSRVSEDALQQNARLLEGVLDDFGVKGEIINVRPGPVVTLYELEPAPGIKSARVIGLADDIARSMSAVSARVAVVPGRNAIGIELPNQRRETVFLRELLASQDFEKTKHSLAIALGKTIGGEPIIVDLGKMPHLLVAGTTGSGKSVAINTMILSLLYRLRPDQCRLIMVDPKMLELSVYDGIPHLLTPVVTDPKKAVVALKWAVREMEDRYKKMSKLGVRNIDGFNARLAESKGATITRTVQTGFDRATGEAIYEQEEMELTVLPYIIVVVDEMADLMMVAGKDIEGAIQRLAQMARAAGIHLIMATQRPSVDVITGTIKANFPTRISFQVTSKIDSRTILNEQGAEQLLGQGDMLYMAGGGRIIRVHGPFVSDKEVEKVVAHLKSQGAPEYLESITVEETSGEEGDEMSAYESEESGDLYDRAVAIVLRDRKCSTSYVQRRLSVGYNKAASLVERMEAEGVVSPANHAGKRTILVGGGIDRGAFDLDD